MQVYKECEFTGQLLKAEIQDDRPINLIGKLIFCLSGEVLLETSQEIYDSIQSKMMIERHPPYRVKENGLTAQELMESPWLIEKDSLVFPAYKGEYEIQGEISDGNLFTVRALVLRDTSVKPNLFVQEVYIEGRENLDSERKAINTFYGLIAFDPLCDINLFVQTEENSLKVEKIDTANEKSLEATLKSELSIVTPEMSISLQEKYAYFLILIMSFAYGVKVYEAYQKNEIINGVSLELNEYWRGSRSRALAKGFGVIQRPHLNKFLDQVINNEFVIEKYRESLILSLSWYLETFESNILATNFVLLCTALEALNEEFKSIQADESSRLLSKAKYKLVRKSILSCIDQHALNLDEHDTPEKYAIFKSKVQSFFQAGDLNMIGRLGSSLKGMLEYFHVKYEDLFPEFDFIKIRNNVVHRGTHDSDEMLEVYLKLESLYIRLMLCILGYKGDYMEYDGKDLICRTVPFTED